MRRVVITGVGPITPIGIGKEAFWEAIKNKKSGIGPVSTFDASIFQGHQRRRDFELVSGRLFFRRID